MFLTLLSSIRIGFVRFRLPLRAGLQPLERRGLAEKGKQARAVCGRIRSGRLGAVQFYSGIGGGIFFEICLAGGNKIGRHLVMQVKARERLDVLEGEDRARFEAIVLPHLDAAFNLARWLLRSRADAEDVAQDAVLRAYRAFGTYRAGNARAWLLQIVRNTCFTWLQQNRREENFTEFDETSMPQESENPEALAIAGSNREHLARPGSAACFVSGNSGAPRTGRLLLQGDCGNHGAPHRDGYVRSGPRAPATPPIPDADIAQGGSPCPVSFREHNCTAISMESWTRLAPWGSRSIWRIARIARTPAGGGRIAEEFAPAGIAL